MDESELIQRLREQWSRAIDNWGRISIFIISGIVSFFATLLLQSNDLGVRLAISFTGWALATTCVVFWRYTVRHIDNQIVGLYPSMLRLEKQAGWETQTQYIFTNLSKESLNELNKCFTLANPLTNADYERFKRITLECGRNHYQVLLSLFELLGLKAVGGRGHGGQDKILFIVDLALSVPAFVYFVKLYLGFYPHIIAIGFFYAVIIVAVGSFFNWGSRSLSELMGERQQLILPLIRNYFLVGSIFFIYSSLMSARDNADQLQVHLYACLGIASMLWALILYLSDWEFTRRFFRWVRWTFESWRMIAQFWITVAAYYLSFAFNLASLAGKNLPDYYFIAFFALGIILLLLIQLGTMNQIWPHKRLSK